MQESSVADAPTAASAFLAEIWKSLAGPPVALERVGFTGSGALASVYAVTDFAAAATASAGLAVSELLRAKFGLAPRVTVDRRLASLWFGVSISPDGWTLPSPWDAIAGDYETCDGWIRLHTNAPSHREAALAILGVAADKEAVTAAVRRWNADELESAVVARGGCAAAMRDAAAWRAHPQGAAVARKPIVERVKAASGRASPRGWPSTPERPLSGVRVLDCTRVLAGPVATRFLAGLGAEVLRIDPPGWEEPAVVPDVTLGKRCARLDMKTTAGHERFAALLSRADVFVHGLRPGALTGLGFDAEARRRICPGLIDVSLDAYGWSGGWAGRRGFDSLVQMSAGIAAEGMLRFKTSRPKPLPVQALDHAAGYVMAAAVLRGLAERLDSSATLEARTSLARMAALLLSQPADDMKAALQPPAGDDYSETVEETAWGPARRLKAPLIVDEATLRWSPAAALGSAEAEWRGATESAVRS